MQLVVGAVGLFHKDAPIKDFVISNITEESPHNFVKTNNLLLDTYENIFLSEGLPDTYVQKLIEKLASNTYLIMKSRFKQFSYNDIAKFISEHAEEISFVDVIAPIRLLRIIEKGYQFELVDDYKT
jgi:hypothetical protein